jgi:glutathione S-transferase
MSRRTAACAPSLRRTDTPEFLAMNPNGIVPVLKDGDGEPLWETGAILRHLGARYGEGPFWLRDAIRRARIDKRAEWAKINVALGFTAPVFWSVVRTAPEDPDEAALGRARATLSRALAIADARLSPSAHLAGGEFTLADIQFGHVLHRCSDIPIACPEHRAVRRYYDALTARPAFREHVMVSYEELRVA